MQAGEATTGEERGAARMCGGRPSGGEFISAMAGDAITEALGRSTGTGTCVCPKRGGGRSLDLGGGAMGPLIALGYIRSQDPTHCLVGEVSGGRCGGCPPAQGRAGTARPSNGCGQWPVVSGQELQEALTAPWLPEAPESVRRLWNPPLLAEDFGGLTNVWRLTMIPALPDVLPLSMQRALCQKLPAFP